MNCANWPSTGEIDVMEDVNALSEHSGTLHCGTDPGGPCNETTGLGSGLQSCSGCQTGYNTYSVIVNRTNTSSESITWYLNGNAYYTATESQVGAATWRAAVDHGFFLILDVAIGGGYPNGVCGCSSPSPVTSSGAATSIGYVAVYQTSGASASPSPSPTSTSGCGGKSCTTTATADISAGLVLQHQHRRRVAGERNRRERVNMEPPRSRHPTIMALQPWQTYRMGIYRDQILPRALDLLMRSGEVGRLRARVAAGLDGEVLEIGCGSGLNIPYYPAVVKRVRAVDPAAVGRKLAAKRAAACPVPVEFVGVDAQALPLDDASIDNVLSTWTLCTIPDAGRALAEIYRVLRPGGALRFVEHGLAPDAGVARVQHRLTPLHQRVAGGCRLDRPIAEMIASAGLELGRLDTYYLTRPHALGYTYEGVAAKP
ncbi:MAG TPA: methyltransferase domain-containing protein [Streptosporangiaceae bacterium]|nr:methyltransferase domain-containing protein [Streptosporangiaceae bacterium]